MHLGNPEDFPITTIIEVALLEYFHYRLKVSATQLRGPFETGVATTETAMLAAPTREIPCETDVTDRAISRVREAVDEVLHAYKTVDESGIHGIPRNRQRLLYRPWHIPTVLSQPGQHRNSSPAAIAAGHGRAKRNVPVARS